MQPVSVGDYLIEKLWNRGVRHVFGIPGDYALRFYDRLQHSHLDIINTCDEQGAGFAADAYARVNGLGAVCITYCVGGLKVANSCAGAFAEKSPVIVISGAPGIGEREHNPLLHHKVRDFATQKKVFEELTVASTVIDDPQRAQAEIDRVFEAVLKYKRPGYIELPRDMVDKPLVSGYQHATSTSTSDQAALAEAIEDAVRLLSQAKRPVILAAVEVHRFGLQDQVLQLAEQLNVPIATTLLGKSVIAETHPHYIGVYEGAMGQEDVRCYVEDSDCLLMLGAFMTDINLGIFTAKLDPSRSISATSERVSIRHHNYDNIDFREFIAGVTAANVVGAFKRDWPRPRKPETFVARPATAVTVNRLFQRLNAFIDDDSMVIADVGDSLFGAADLFIHRRTEFLAPAYYASMGFAIPAAIGAQLARPTVRPLALVGDGAFQMTGVELSTAVRYRLNPIVIVLNNRGYGTERPMQEGPFNDIELWNYSKLPQLINGGQGYLVSTETELDEALAAAAAHRDSFCLIDVRIAQDDRSQALQRLASRMAECV